MKLRFVTFVLFLLAFGTVCLCSCKKGGEKEPGGNTDENGTVGSKENGFVYSAENIGCFYTDARGYVFAYLPNDGCIIIYDNEGRETQTIPAADRDYISLCPGEGVIYAAFQGDDPAFGIGIAELSMENQEVSVVYENKLGNAVFGMERIEKNLYFLERQAILDLELAEEKNDPEMNYFYGGERLLRLSLETFQVKEIEVDCIKGFCRKGNDGLVVFAYDIEAGDYYFADYAVKKELCKEPNYVGQSSGGEIGVFAYDTANKKLLFSDTYQKTIFAAPLEGFNQKTPFFTPSEGRLTQIFYQKGSTFYLSEGKVCRVKNDDFMVDYHPIKILSQAVESGLPEGTGYALEIETMTEEALATAIMAGDSDFDFLLLSSTLPLAEQLRRTGAFEPLNDVEGVRTYLDGCFDYITEAAENEQGIVWMLPYEIDCDVLVYNKELCQKLGISLESDYSNEMLWEAEQLLHQSFEKNPTFSKYRLNWDRSRMIDLYLRDYAVKDGKVSFDNELFRKYLTLWKENVDSGLPKRKVTEYDNIYPYSIQGFSQSQSATAEEVKEKMQGFYSKVSMGCLSNFDLIHQNGTYDENGKKIGEFYGISAFDFFDVKPMPSLDEKNPQKSAAYAFFLVLNPKSKNKETAKDFLSAVSKILCKRENFSRTKELKEEKNPLLLKAHDIYEKAEIIFRIPEDVCKDEISKYLNGEKSIDEVIPELERKLNAYWKE